MREIPLTKGFRALVDDEDFEAVAQHRWQANTGRGFSAEAIRKDGARTVLMHREIMGAPDGVQVDHLRHRDLAEKVIDNRRTNLRFASQTENQGNSRKLAAASSPFKGVSWHKARRKWRAAICRAGIRRSLGYFADESLAAYAYDLAAVEIFGAFALTNFPVPGSVRSLWGPGEG